MGELVTIHEPRPLDAYRMSTDAAGACAEIVKRTAVKISGRRHVTVEGWQAIAIAHGCAASSDHVERVTDEGCSGYKAMGIVRRMSDGQEIARAEGFIGDDENTWKNRAVYARRAMVQTRAISRACRSAFAHVVVMIDGDLATTPAEEMIAFDGATGEIIEPAPQREKVPGISAIKTRLNKFMREGDACTEIEPFRKLVKANKDDIKKIRDANHEYWTGDGEDSEGFGAWMERRYAELTPKEHSLEYQLLVSTLNECGSQDEYQAWLAKNGDVIDTLDGAEGREFETLHDQKVEALGKPAQPTPLTAGALGG